MRPCSIEAFAVILDYGLKVPDLDNRQVIKAFSPRASQEPFADSVGLRTTVGRVKSFNRTCPGELMPNRRRTFYPDRGPGDGSSSQPGHGSVPCATCPGRGEEGSAD